MTETAEATRRAQAEANNGAPWNYDRWRPKQHHPAPPSPYGPLNPRLRQKYSNLWVEPTFVAESCGATVTIGGPVRFHQLLKELGDLHDRKAHDYAPGEDRFANFRQCESLGIPAYEGAVIRMLDKVSRITNLINRAKQGERAAVDESLTDTLKDLAAYALITIELREQEQSDASSH
jgi:hypothetical protein